MKHSIINIDGEPFHFERVSWNYSPNGAFDKTVAKNCLSLFNQILSNNNIPFMLTWGTLLGAIRDNDFIANDTDIDVMVFEKDLPNLLRTIPVLYKSGIKLCRYTEGRIYSFLYEGMILDIDVIRHTFFPYSIRYYSLLECFIPKKYLIIGEKIHFYGLDLVVMQKPESFLEYIYGKTWKIPIKGDGGRIMPKWMILEKLYYKIRRKIKYIRFKKMRYDDPDFY